MVVARLADDDQPTADDIAADLRRAWRRLELVLPVHGPHSPGSALGRFASSLAELRESSMPLEERIEAALQLAARLGVGDYDELRRWVFQPRRLPP
jgi:hypothetical protein